MFLCSRGFCIDYSTLPVSSLQNQRFRFLRGFPHVITSSVVVIVVDLCEGSTKGCLSRLRWSVTLRLGTYLRIYHRSAVALYDARRIVTSPLLLTSCAAVVDLSSSRHENKMSDKKNFIAAGARTSTCSQPLLRWSQFAPRKQLHRHRISGDVSFSNKQEIILIEVERRMFKIFQKISN